MSLPQPLHLSAARVLIQSKPDHLTIQGFILALRQSTRITHVNGKIHREIDHSAFWQNQYDTLRNTLEKERDVYFVLKQQNESLEAQLTPHRAHSNRGRKRKSVEWEEPEKENVKRIKAGTIAIAEFGLAADIDPVIKAMRHMHRVQTLCIGRMWSTEPNDLAYNLIQTTKALESIVNTLADKKRSANACKQTITAVARSCITVYHGLKKMESLAGNDHFSSHVIHACVCFFGSLFTSLEKAASVQVESRNPTQETHVLQALSMLAASLITKLRESAPTCPSHAEILEGATYDLLHRLGETTHELLMDGPRNDDIEHEMRNLPLLEDKRLDPVRQTAMRTMLTCAPFLLDSLRKALLDVPDMSLAATARLKLQRTLVDRIFGPGTIGADGNEDILRLPQALGEAPVAVKAVRTEDISAKTDEFEAELWALVGWEILGDEQNL